MRRLVIIAALLVVATACGGNGDATAPPVAIQTVETVGKGSELPEWVSSYVSAPGPEVAIVFGTGDFGVGSNRVAFLIVRNDGSLVAAKTAEVRIAPAASESPVRVTATLRAVLPPTQAGSASDGIEALDFYVADVDVPTPGRYWLVAQPEGEKIQALGAIEVREETASPQVGSQAIASDNPTLDDAPAQEITTAKPPDTELLRYSIATSLKERVPFVVVFATPEFCQTRACGPTVETVDQVRRSIGEKSGIRFIHVEVYKDNDPLKGVNRWFEEWRLPSEPWVFIVDGGGVIRAKFEGLISLEEVEEAVRRYLL